MKITLTLTKQELLNVLSKHFGATINVLDVQEDSLADEIDKLIRQFRYTGDQKISAIKALREFCAAKCGGAPGLADTKWIVENYEQFIKFVRATGQLPLQYPITEQYYQARA